MVKYLSIQTKPSKNPLLCKLKNCKNKKNLHVCIFKFSMRKPKFSFVNLSKFQVNKDAVSVMHTKDKIIMLGTFFISALNLNIINEIVLPIMASNMINNEMYDTIFENK